MALLFTHLSLFVCFSTIFDTLFVPERIWPDDNQFDQMLLHQLRYMSDVSTRQTPWTLLSIDYDNHTRIDGLLTEIEI